MIIQPFEKAYYVYCITKFELLGAYGLRIKPAIGIPANPRADMAPSFNHVPGAGIFRDFGILDSDHIRDHTAFDQLS